eukprot:1161274-Pelagomonas_calceolata.AAC.3
MKGVAASNLDHSVIKAVAVSNLDNYLIKAVAGVAASNLDHSLMKGCAASNLVHSLMELSLLSFLVTHTHIAGACWTTCLMTNSASSAPSLKSQRC